MLKVCLHTNCLTFIDVNISGKRDQMFCRRRPHEWLFCIYVCQAGQPWRTGYETERFAPTGLSEEEEKETEDKVGR